MILRIIFYFLFLSSIFWSWNNVKLIEKLQVEFKGLFFLDHLRISCQPDAHHPLNALVCLSYKQEHPLTVHNTTNTIIKLTLTLHYNLILRPLLSINVVHRSRSQSHIASRQVPFLISFRIEQF